ncbi:unnamed protein product [Lathyrus sativus]|nr:unnamed protein product [Lathyrus sativus]
MTLLNNNTNEIDRISDLPSNVIDVILGNLEIRDQVSTSILSKKWRYLWTSAPHLCFDDDFFRRLMGVHDDVVFDIIMDVLMLHNGPIYKFSIDLFNSFEFNTEKFNMLIPFMSRDIKHLELVICGFGSVEDQMLDNLFLDILFSCKELTYFKFNGCKNLAISSNFRGIKKLLELDLECDEIESSALETFMSGCPILEKLSIGFRFGCDHLVISSPSLKVLVLELYSTKSICLKKANNLIDFTLKLSKLGTIVYIKSLPQIKKFSLTNWGEIPLADIIPPTLLTSSFSSLEYLKLDEFNLNDKGDILYFVTLLKSAPCLVKLVIEDCNFNDTTQVSDHLKELECRSCCLKLQTAEIFVAASTQHGMSLIQFILGNSPLLKTLTLNVCSYGELDGPMLKISQDLLRMERASPRAQVNFIHSAHRRRQGPMYL